MQQLPKLEKRNVRIRCKIEKLTYTKKSIVYCGDLSKLTGKIAFFNGKFVKITKTQSVSKHTVECYLGSIVEYKELKADQVDALFVVRFRKPNGKQYKVKAKTAQQVIEWASKKSYPYTLYIQPQEK